MTCNINRGQKTFHGKEILIILRNNYDSQIVVAMIFIRFAFLTDIAAPRFSGALVIVPTICTKETLIKFINCNLLIPQNLHGLLFSSCVLHLPSK